MYERARSWKSERVSYVAPDFAPYRARDLEAIADAFERDGFVSVSGVIPSEEVGDVRERFMEAVAADTSLGWDDGVPPEDPLAAYPRFVQPHRHPESAAGVIARKYMLDSRLVGVVERLVGPALGAQSMFYFKPPTARGQALHQDNLFLQAYPETCLAMWIAIDPADGENGGLVVVPGSHRLEILCPEPADPAVSFTSDTVSLPDGMSVVQTILDAGDVLFFHGSLVHGSPPNRSPTRFRRALIFHYVPAASTEVASLYQPLIARDASEVWIDVAATGGPCGTGFAGEA